MAFEIMQLLTAPFLAHDEETGQKQNTTGHVGLYNFGLTCFLNSVVQILFQLPKFKQIICDSPEHQS
jgi:uncharacterized UBP type Zn finger protein